MTLCFLVMLRQNDRKLQNPKPQCVRIYQMSQTFGLNWSRPGSSWKQPKTLVYKNVVFFLSYLEIWPLKVVSCVLLTMKNTVQILLDQHILPKLIHFIENIILLVWVIQSCVSLQTVILGIIHYWHDVS